mgnify:CR=1 FL=1
MDDIWIDALLMMVEDDEDALVCPLRATLQYIQPTAFSFLSGLMTFQRNASIRQLQSIFHFGYALLFWAGFIHD